MNVRAQSSPALEASLDPPLHPNRLPPPSCCLPHHPTHPGHQQSHLRRKPKIKHIGQDRRNMRERVKLNT